MSTISRIKILCLFCIWNTEWWATLEKKPNRFVCREQKLSKGWERIKRHFAPFCFLRSTLTDSYWFMYNMKYHQLEQKLHISEQWSKTILIILSPDCVFLIESWIQKLFFESARSYTCQSLVEWCASNTHVHKGKWLIYDFCVMVIWGDLRWF